MKHISKVIPKALNELLTLNNREMIKEFEWQGKPKPNKYDIHEVVDVAYLPMPVNHGAVGANKTKAKITIEWVHDEGYKAVLWWFNRGIEMARYSHTLEECKDIAFSWWVSFLMNFLVHNNE